MLINETGRVEDNMDGMKPSDFSLEIPEHLKKSCVGIFWHTGNNQWIIRKAEVLDDSRNAVEMGQDYDEETNPEDLQIDFNSFHKDIWNDEIRSKKQEWEDIEYSYFSRGRIVFAIQKKKFIIYIPNSPYFTGDAVLFLARMFQIPLVSFDTNSKIYKKKKDMESLGAGENTVLPV